MAEVFSDDLNLKIGDLLSRNLLPATRPPCARPFLLRRPIQAHKSMFARPFTHARPLHARSRCYLREIPFTLAPALCTHTLLLARHQRLKTLHPENITQPSPRVFQEPKTLPEYKHFKPSTPLNP
jgi:hypothetical protein